MPAPAFSQAAPGPAPAPSVLPSNAEDFQCFVLLQQRRAVYAADAEGDPARRAEIVNNLTIVSAYYAGRISHYPTAEAVTQYASAVDAVNAATDEQRDAYATRCADAYLAVMSVLGTTGQQVARPGQ